MRTPNYHDFYQKALVPIGSKDRLSLQESDSYNPELASTHWLIAVEGAQLPQTKIYYHWKVTIYPSTDEGDFNWKKPYFCSRLFESIDKANELAGSFVKFCKQDSLSTVTPLEKIS